jgi:hypothetical protein
MTHLRNALRAAALVVAAVSASGAGAADLQISQVADRSADLAVFLSGANLPAAAASAPSAASASFSAALGDRALRVKSSTPWDAASGVSLVVALDVSASIGSANFDAIKRDLTTVLGTLPPHSQVALLAIGADVRPVRPFGPPAAAIGALDTLVPDAPETALYESLLVAQQLANKAAPDLPLRRMVLVLTDGMDDSRHGFGLEEVLPKISQGDVPVFALALAPQRTPVAQREAIKALAQIARASGGDTIQSTTAAAGGNLGALMRDALRAQLLTLDCSACKRDSVVRSLDVSLRQRDVTVTASRPLHLSVLPPGVAQPPASVPVSGLGGASGAHKSVTKEGAAKSPWDRLSAWLGLPGLAMALAIAAAGIGAVVWKRRHSPLKTTSKPSTEWSTPAGIALADDGTGMETGSATVSAELRRPRHNDGRAVTLDIAGQGRMKVRIGHAEVVLGRSKQADVPMETDAEASNRHACVYLRAGAVMLRDLGSFNGTWLNGARIVRPEPVQDRDLIRVGRTEIIVNFDAA